MPAGGLSSDHGSAWDFWLVLRLAAKIRRTTARWQENPPLSKEMQAASPMPQGRMGGLGDMDF